MQDAALRLAGFGISVRFGLGHQIEGNRQAGRLGGIEGGQEVEAFDVALMGMIPMPTDEIVFVGVRFLLDAVIDDEYPVGVFNLPKQGLDDAPQVGTGFGWRREKAGDLIMGDFAIKQARETGGGGRAKGTDQVVGIEVEHRFVHRSSLLLERNCSEFHAAKDQTD